MKNMEFMRNIKEKERRIMIRKKILTLVSLGLCITLLAACSADPPLSGNNAGEKVSGESQEEMADTQEEDVLLDVNQDFSDFEETEDGTADERSHESSIAASEENAGAEGTTGYSEESDLQMGSIGMVEMTGLSGEDSRTFTGKEMIADPEYLEQAPSSDVFYCEAALSKIEVHPIEKWAENYSSYTISDEVLAAVESTAAEEPFRIYDVYPEGIPVNCLVFYLEDGSCGTFSLGYNGSGDEHVWDNPIYKNYASMNASRAKELEEGAVAWILDLYRELAEKYENGESLRDYIHQRLLDGRIPSFGDISPGYDGEPMYYSSESHFVEICGGTISYIGVARIDINHDGSDELIMGGYPEEDSSDRPTILYAAYSVKGGEINTIFQGWGRSYYFLAEDGSIIHGGSGGAANYEILKYDLTGNVDEGFSLKETETVVVDGFTYPDEPYFYYPKGREIVGYTDDGVPEYSFDNVIQLDEEAGRPYFDNIVDQEIHIDLERID